MAFETADGLGCCFSNAEEKKLDYAYVEINPYEVDDKLPGAMGQQTRNIQWKALRVTYLAFCIYETLLNP